MNIKRQDIPKCDVCVMTTYHEPTDDRIFQKEILSLRNAGHEVILIAPSKRRTFLLDGVRILGIRRRRNFARLISVLIITVKAAKIRAAVYHFHEPELLMAAMVLRMFTKARFVYDVHEEHSYSMLARLSPGIVRNVLASIIVLIEKALSPHMDHVIVVAPELEKKFRAYGCTSVTQILLGAQLSAFKYPQQGYIPGYSPVVAQEGSTIDIAWRGLDKGAFAAKLVVSERKDARFLVIGEIPIADKKWVDAYLTDHQLLDRFTFVGRVSYSEVPRLLSNCNIGLLCLQPATPNLMSSMPNKLFDYMASSMPVVASRFPNIERVVTEEQCGILVDPTDPRELADAILYLANNPEEAKRLGKNGRKAVECTYSWERMEKRLFDIYSGLLN